MRHCKECKMDLPDDMFYRNVSIRLCKPHFCTYSRKYGARYRKNPKNKETRWSKQLQRYYGITLVEYNTLLDKQGHCCALCGQGEMEDGAGKRLAVDHNHTTGEIRGLLCSACNRGIGMLKENVAVLRKAIEYLS